MLFVVTLENDRERELMLENIKFARERFGFFGTYFRGAAIEDEGKLDLLLEQEKEGAHKIVWRGSMTIDGINHMLSTPLVMRLIRENRWKIWVPKDLGL